jgi:hypothetical protein
MKRFFFYFGLIAFSMLTACTKEVRDTAVDVLSGEETLISKMKQIEGAQNYITLSSDTRGLGHKKKSYQINASLSDQASDICSNITINNDIVMERFVPRQGLGLSNQFISNREVPISEYAQLFGKKVQCNVNAKPNQVLETRGLTGGSITTPDEIEVTMPSGSPVNGSNAISVPRNAPLRWNPDPNNRSVYILVLFDPQSVVNFRYSNARRKTAFHMVRDNGSFTIPASDFDGIPVGGHIEILIARGNTALLGGTSNGTGSTALTAYSMATLVATSGGGSCGDCIEVFP